MTSYFFISIYIISLFSIFILPLYINIKRDRIIVLSFLPPLLIATTVSISMLISSFMTDKSLIDSFLLSIFIFFEFLLGGYIVMFPILILVSFIVEYLRIFYHYKPLKLAIIGGVVSALIMGISFMTWKFIWVALISGFLSILIQYYFTEYKKEYSQNLESRTKF